MFTYSRQGLYLMYTWSADCNVISKADVTWIALFSWGSSCQ